MASSSHTRHHSAPRISANDLARYMVAGETGKLGIIRRAREAKSAITTRYGKVRDDIIAYLCDVRRSKATLAALQSKYVEMSDDVGLSPWQREDARLSVDVLKSLGGMENQIAGVRFLSAPTRQSPLLISGVSVSVALNVLQIRDRGDKAEVGGVLFRMTKADEETDAAASKRRDIGQYTATLSYMQSLDKLKGERSPHHQLCASFDIQCGEVHVAPRTFAARAKDLENACRFIAAMWAVA